jgi:predicted nucleic acid-binding protein
MNDGRGLVVDASVAAKWHLRDEDHVEEAEELLRRHVVGDLWLAAPAFIRHELAQVLERARRARRIPEDQALRRLRAFLELKIHAQFDTDELVALALEIAQHTGATAYDAMYLAYAEELGLDVVTADEELIGQASGYSVTTLHLTEVLRLL